MPTGSQSICQVTQQWPLSLLPLLLCMAATRSHDTSQTLHPIIQLPIRPSQKGTHTVRSVSTICTNCSGKGRQPNMLFNLMKEKAVSKCVRTQCIPFCFHLLPLFLTHWASDPLDMSVITKIKQHHHHEVTLHIITE